MIDRLLEEIALRWSVPLLVIFGSFLADRRPAKRFFPAQFRNSLCRTLLVWLFLLPLFAMLPVPSAVPPLLPRISVALNAVPPIETVFYLYLVVAAFLTARLCLGIHRLRSIVRASEPIDTAVRVDGTAVDIRRTDEFRAPVVLCLRRPCILVPCDWPDWSPEDRTAVLTHELAHLRRRDGRWQWASTLAVALFWFHPGVWWLRRELLASAEECCDREVLDIGIDPHRYAWLLLSLAVAESGTLERRLQLVRQPFATTAASYRWLAVATAGLALLFALPPAAQPDPGYDPATLEMKLRADNSNALFLHARLATIYWNLRRPQGYNRHLRWLIDHHLGDPVAGFGSYPARLSVAEGPLSEAWLRALAREPQSNPVAINAGRWFMRSNPKRALQLFRRAHSQPDLENLTVQAAYREPALRDELVEDVNRQQDPAQLSSLGGRLAVLDDKQTAETGIRLLVRAIELQPDNPRWREALDSALAEPARRAAFKKISATYRPQ